MKGLIKIARNQPNKGKAHIFLGNPLSDGCDKTVVEPGNSFSPGIWTCGIYTWVKADGQYYAPELLSDSDIAWSFGGQDGFPPEVVSVWRAGSGVNVKNSLTHLGTEGAEGVDFCNVELSSSDHKEVGFFLVVKDIGPAGGKIASMAWCNETSTLLINGCIRLISEDKPDNCEIIEAEENNDSPMAVLQYDFELPINGTKKLSFKVEHGFGNKQFGDRLALLEPYRNLSVAEGFERSHSEWQRAIPTKVFCPDRHLEKVWERECFHILSAMECGLPRIGAVNYPAFWIRDGVIILRMLDLIGRHDLARTGNEYLAPLFFGGGFGAEADAPGEGIWSLVSHFRMTKDLEWLKGVFPYIKKRAALILQMLKASKPIRMVGESRIPFYLDSPGINLLCFPSSNGTIHGRMDWHSPDFFINCWSECGLRLASEAARLLGSAEYADEWLEAAERLEKSIAEHLLPGYGNERDSIITPYPSNALRNSRNTVGQKFMEWFKENRLTPGGERKPELLWTYFEAAQIHNAILLGFREEAWKCLNGMLATEGSWDLSYFIESFAGANETLPFRNAEKARGWLDEHEAVGGNMPHNWTSAELINLIRDIFVVEDSGTVLLGKGVPREWLKPGAKFGVENMPTDMGLVSYTATVSPDGSLMLDYKGPGKYKLAL